MPPKRSKVPATPRSEYIDKLADYLMERDRKAALRFLLAYFTTIDMEFIWNDLQTGKTQVPK